MPAEGSGESAHGQRTPATSVHSQGQAELVPGRVDREIARVEARPSAAAAAATAAVRLGLEQRRRERDERQTTRSNRRWLGGDNPRQEQDLAQ